MLSKELIVRDYREEPPVYIFSMVLSDGFLLLQAFLEMVFSM